MPFVFWYGFYRYLIILDLLYLSVVAEYHVHRI